jgi:predicted GIY-YIG superfamily endonuclease
MSEKYLIYMIVNDINEKIYIGKTTNLEQREYNHWKMMATSDYPLYQDMREYGFDEFFFIEL